MSIKNIFLIILVLVCLAPKQTQSQKPSSFLTKNDSMVSAAVNLVNSDSVGSYIQALQDMVTRFLIASNRKEVATWIMNKYRSFGIDSVRLDSFQCYTNISYQALQFDTTTWQYNVVARIEGSLYPNEVILIGGHYDDVVPTGNPLLFAPGADDNASGTSAAIETARVIMEMDYHPALTIEFLAFAAEELMYFGDAGSRDYANKCAAAGKNIILMINNDMIGNNSGGNIKVGISDFYNCDFATNLADSICENYTSLDVYQWPPSAGSADAEAFYEKGYKCVYMEEYVFSPFYHKITDSINKMDLDYCSEVIKISTGSVLYADIHTGIDEYKTESKFVKLFPNPVKDNFFIPEYIKNIRYIRIYNSYGALNKEIINNSAQGIDVSALSCGMYIVHIQTDEGLILGKIIKQ